MSYDIHLFFERAEFPEFEWADVLRLFRATESDLSSGDIEDCIVRRWGIVCDDGAVRIALRRLIEGRHHIPRESYWDVLIDRSSHSARCAWTQFAVAVYAIEMIPGVAFYDAQTGTLLNTRDDLLVYASRLVSAGGRKNELRRLGLITDDKEMIL
jgi:hypothetical protein